MLARDRVQRELIKLGMSIDSAKNIHYCIETLKIAMRDHDWQSCGHVTVTVWSGNSTSLMKKVLNERVDNVLSYMGRRLPAWVVPFVTVEFAARKVEKLSPWCDGDYPSFHGIVSDDLNLRAPW